MKFWPQISPNVQLGLLLINRINLHNNLNSRIMALRERTYTSINNSFRNDSRDNFSSSINSEIVLPSNFAFRK